jgi:hypothetical protein
MWIVESCKNGRGERFLENIFTEEGWPGASGPLEPLAKIQKSFSHLTHLRILVTAWL